ncbi:PIN domain-containing protein [Nitrosopumilus sp.]|uniref:PIN domain-containing protein n=1 Tax=Nitrosopumilus sp. TaxID=2024843 RepID=UPI0034A04910
MVKVICDTSFLIHLATKRIKNIDRLDVEIGQITFVVPQVVKNELSELAKKPDKKQDVELTQEYIKNFQIVPISGTFADKELLDYVSKNRIIVATMDKNLKKQIKSNGSSVMSFSNDKIVLET